MNSKRLCRNCNDYFRPENVKDNLGFCSESCKINFSMNFIDKRRKKAVDRLKADKVERRKRKDDEFKIMKRNYRKSSLRIRQDAAKSACHAYIRASSSHLCISCSNPLEVGFHAGHFLESGNYPFIRYHEDNISGQCISCNSFKGGNSAEYRKNLIKKIGLKRVEWLEDNKNNPCKRTAEDYREIELFYKEKLKYLDL